MISDDRRADGAALRNPVAQSHRETVELTACLNGAISLVSAEKFIPAVATEGDFYIAGGFRGRDNEWEGPTNRRTVPRTRRPSFGRSAAASGSDDEFMVLRSEMSGDRSGVFGFIVTVVFKARWRMFEPDRPASRRRR